MIGALPGLTADAVPRSDYQSTAELMVVPSTKGVVDYSSVDRERYVAGQLEVLLSDSLAGEVAQFITRQSGEAISVAALGSLVEIEQIPETDVVTITTTIDSAEKAQAISQAYAEFYLARLASVEIDDRPVKALRQQIGDLEVNLREANDQLQQSMEKWLPRPNDPAPGPIPNAETVDPVAASQRQLLLADLTQKRAALGEIEIQSRLQVNSRIISAAPLPLSTVPPGGDFLLAGGLLGGAILGIVIAVSWARFSTKVLDEAGVEALLGAPVVAELAKYRSLSRNLLAAFQSLPRSAWPVVDQLCVRAEAMAPIGEPLTVVVTGTMRSAGTTTLALAMAERFAAGGATVVLVDADVRDPRVTGLFNAGADGGVPAVTSRLPGLVDEQGRSAFTRTMDPAVSVLGLGPNRGTAALRRDTVPDVVSAATSKADIVVVDGGPVLDLASTLQFVSLADAVVLAVPIVRQKADALGSMGRQLQPVQSKLMPVITSPTRRRAKGPVSVHRSPVAAAPVVKPKKLDPQPVSVPADTGTVPVVSSPGVATTNGTSERPPSVAVPTSEPENRRPAQSSLLVTESSEADSQVTPIKQRTSLLDSSEPDSQ